MVMESPTQVTRIGAAEAEPASSSASGSIVDCLAVLCAACGHILLG
jgi:hypothetical protein